MKAAIILRAQQRTRLVVENLIRGPPGQTQHLAAAFRVGVTKEVLAFVDESLAVDIDHDPIWVGVAMFVRALDIGSCRVYQDGMPAAPMADRLRAESQGKIQNLAGVVARAADFHQVPSRSKIAGTHFRVGFEAAGGQNNRTAMEVGCSFSRLHADASDLGLFL